MSIWTIVLIILVIGLLGDFQASAAARMGRATTVAEAWAS